MPGDPPDRIRNIGIISHIDAGKTTISERLLYYSGAIHKIGEVHDGQAVMDWMDDEQQRGITITASANTFNWNNYSINLIDTPGHIDFTIEVERSLRVLDGAIAVFSAVEGVQPQSESVWRQAKRYQVPTLCFINKMDRVGADPERVIDEITERFQVVPTPLQIPVGIEAGFVGVIDLLDMELLRFTGSEGEDVERGVIPPEYQEQADRLHEQLIDAAADNSPELFEAVIAGDRYRNEQVIAGLRAGVVAGAITPLLYGSALRNKGVQPLLDAICAYLPSPLDRNVEVQPVDDPEATMLPCDSDGPFIAFAFKVIADQGRKLTYLRVYSGTLAAGDQIANISEGVEDRVARLFVMHANKRERRDRVQAGDIVAATGLKTTFTGNSLCSIEGPHYLLAGITIPEPVVSLAIEGKGASDREGLFPALEKLVWEDPTFKFREDEETGQLIISGLGELHLEIIISRLQREFGVEVHSGKPQVVYRETVGSIAKHRSRFEADIDGIIHCGDVQLQVIPEPGSGGAIADIEQPIRERLSEHEVTALFAAMEESLTSGPLSGYPLIDMQLTLTGCVPPGEEETLLGTQNAIRRGVRELIQLAKPILLQPVMMVEIVAPDESTGRVIGSLKQKGARILGLEQIGEEGEVKGLVPLSKLFGYITELRSLSKGRASMHMEFHAFEPE